MTTASKCLVIITTVASLVFFIFISVGTFAGPNYADQMREKDLSSLYIFSSETTFDGKSYSVETRRVYPSPTTHGEAPEFKKVTTPILPKAVLETRKHLKALQEGELTVIERKITKLEKDKNLTEAAKKVDLAALEARLDQLSDVLDATNDDFIKLAQDANQVALDTVRTHKEADKRRQEISQVEQQQKEILTDHYGIVEQIKELENLFIRLTGTVARLEKRRQQLLARGAKIEKPITAETKSKSKPKSVGEK